MLQNGAADKHTSSAAAAEVADKDEAQRPTSTHSRRSSTSSTSSISSLFESSLALLGSLPVATSASTSNSAKPILHQSLNHGELKLYLSKMDTYDELQLQSHMLWPSSPKLSELMEEGKIGSVEGERVLELGAGSALCSLLAARMGASHVEITDYPSDGIFDAIRKNVSSNLNEEEQSRVSISPLDWTDESALQDMADKHPEGFTRILAADTLWMGHLNKSQIRVMTTLLARTSEARICLVAGLHTGRHVIRSFLEESKLQGLEIVHAKEIDRLDADNISGLDWKWIVEEKVDQDTVFEGIEEDRRRWLAFAILKWPQASLSSQ